MNWWEATLPINLDNLIHHHLLYIINYAYQRTIYLSHHLINNTHLTVKLEKGGKV